MLMVDNDQDQRVDEWNQNIWELICASLERELVWQRTVGSGSNYLD